MSGQRNYIPACRRNHIANAGMSLPCLGEVGLGSNVGT